MPSAWMMSGRPGWPPGSPGRSGRPWPSRRSGSVCGRSARAWEVTLAVVLRVWPLPVRSASRTTTRRPSRWRAWAMSTPAMPAPTRRSPSQLERVRGSRFSIWQSRDQIDSIASAPCCIWDRPCGAVPSYSSQETLTVCGELGVSAALAAAEAGVDGVGDEPGPEAAAGAHAHGRAGGDVQILGHHEFDAPDMDVPAGGKSWAGMVKVFRPREYS